MIRALAVVWARNEGDILEWTLGHLIDQGIDVLVVENWSEDQTLELARAFAETVNMGELYVRVERWPLVEPSTVSWAAMLRHTAQVALLEHGRGYDWILHHDADEIRRSTREGETLIEAITRLDTEGYTAIDHTVEVYKPRETWDDLTMDPETWFTERHEKHIDMANGQVRVWKQPDVLVDLASTAGHSVLFPGRVVAPEKLLMKHYPLRTPEQAARKIAARERWDERERTVMGWHLPFDERVKA